MKAQTCFALVDCNNFYVSCERVFRPDLQDKPVGVLSNNDGCFVARSSEVKELGIKMGTPLFKVQDLVDSHGITLFSSNYALYADMSSRVMSTLESFAPRMEVYSIDEAFLDFSGMREDLVSYSQGIRKTVQRSTGIPVSVGIAPTKTLAKLANYAAKKWKKTQGVVDLSDPVRRDKLMQLTPVGEIWGIGSRTQQKLNAMGIHTAYDLAIQPPQTIQKQFNITVSKTVMELNGVSCIELEPISSDKQQIVCSRSFGKPLTSVVDMSAALSEYCTRAAEKLRGQHSKVYCISVFVRTNPFSRCDKQYSRSATLKLDVATQDTRVIVTAANELLHHIYKAGYRYQKCGVQFSHLVPVSTPEQLILLDNQRAVLPKENPTLMAAIDKINRKFPKSISLGSALSKGVWQSKADQLSPHYTTRWNELMVVK
jgi:DNA polymerase V